MRKIWSELNLKLTLSLSRYFRFSRSFFPHESSLVIILNNPAQVSKCHPSRDPKIKMVERGAMIFQSRQSTSLPRGLHRATSSK